MFNENVDNVRILINAPENAILHNSTEGSAVCFDIFQTLKEQIKFTQKEILISSYNLLHNEIVNLLIETQHRLKEINPRIGRKNPAIRIYLDEDQQRRYDKSLRKVNRLRDSGILVVLCPIKNIEGEKNHHGNLHTKLFIRDPFEKNPVAIIGSANLSNNAEKHSIEMGVELSGPCVQDIYTLILSLLENTFGN